MTSDEEIQPRDSRILLDYLKELLTDRSNLANSSGPYIHVGKILEKEILKIRIALLSDSGICTITENELPEPEGPKVNLQSKIYIPVDPNNSFNFVGRILGPEGSTAKCLQQCLGVKIMIRGRGSMRDRKKEEANVGRPNWEHLNDNLHILITTEDYENRAKARLKKASEYINLFLKESLNGSEKEDKVKQMQLVELSIRKELRSNPWHLNFNGLPDYGFPSKSNPVLSNVGSVNLGFGCSSTSFYPTLQHNQHYGPFPAQYQHHTMNNASRTGHLGSISHPSFSPSAAASGLNATLILSNGVGPYPSPFSPNSNQSPAGQTIQTALAVPPVNYWSNTPGISHLSPSYPTQSSFSHQPGDSETQSNHEHPTLDTVASNSHVPTDVPVASSDASDLTPPNVNAIFISSHQNSQQLPRIHEESVGDPLIKEFSSCNLNSNKEKGGHGSTNSSLVLNASKSLYGSQNSSNSLGSKTNPTRRYSQKHNPHLSSKSSSPANRSSLVVVKVGAMDQAVSTSSQSSAAVDVSDSTSNQQTRDTTSANSNLGSEIELVDLRTEASMPQSPTKSVDLSTEDTGWANKDIESTSKPSSLKSYVDDSVPGIDDSSLVLFPAQDAAASHSSEDTASTVSSTTNDNEQDNKSSCPNETK